MTIAADARQAGAPTGHQRAEYGGLATRARPRRARGEVAVDGPSLRDVASTPLARYFVATPFAKVLPEKTGRDSVLGGPFHAKEMGTLTTLCGKATESWVKVWELRFETVLDNCCGECRRLSTRRSSGTSSVDRRQTRVLADD